jgi:HEAT repeat protein
MSKDTQHLITELNSSDKRVVFGAIYRLGDLRDPVAVEPLITLLKSEDHEIRGAAADSLARIGDTRAIQPLLETLLFEDPEGFVTNAVGDMGEVVVEPLLGLLKHPDKEVRARAAHALGGTQDPRAIHPLILTLAYDAEDDYYVANTALAALTFFHEAALKPLVAALQDEASQIRQSAALALGHLYNPQAVKPLVIALSDPVIEVRYGAVGALGQIGAPEALSALERVVKEDNSRTPWGETIADAAKEAIEEIYDRIKLRQRLANENAGS